MSADDKGFSESQSPQIGGRLRAFRRAAGLTIDDVAVKAGVTKSFVSRFERDEVQASVATLLRLCESIGVGMGTIFEPSKASYVPAGKGVPVSLGGERMQEYLINGSNSGQLMALQSLIEPGGGSGSELYRLNASVDLVHVLEGELELVVDSETYRLHKGDTLTFAPSIPHSWVNPSTNNRCIALWIIVPPPT